MHFVARKVIPVPVGPSVFFPYTNIGAHGVVLQFFTAGFKKRLRIFDDNLSLGTSILFGDVMPVNGVEDTPALMVMPLSGEVLQFVPIDSAAYTVVADFYDSPPGRPYGQWVSSAGTETFPAGGGSDSIVIALGDFSVNVCVIVQCDATGTAALRFGDANTFAFVSGGPLLTNGGGTTVVGQALVPSVVTRFITLDIVSTDLVVANTFTWLAKFTGA